MDPLTAHDNAVAAIASGSAALKHVEERHDRSDPVVEPDVTLRTWNKAALLEEIASAGEVPLRHVDEPNDKSAPVIEGNLHVQPSNRAAHLSAIQAVGAHSALVHELKEAGAPELRHVETEDKAAPHIEPGVTLKTWDKHAFLAEVASPSKPLQHVQPEAACDRSAPAIDSSVEVKRFVHNALLEDIRTGGPQDLKHVEPQEVHDRSIPQVTHTAALRVSGGAVPGA